MEGKLNIQTLLGVMYGLFNNIKTKEKAGRAVLRRY